MDQIEVEEIILKRLCGREEVEEKRCLICH
jgi:hypothetical protein